MFSKAQKTDKYLIPKKKDLAISSVCLHNQLPLLSDAFYITSAYVTLMYLGLYYVIYYSTRKLLVTHKAVLGIF